METLEFSQFRPRLCTVHAALFRDATNSADLIHLLKTKGAEAFPLQMALIDAAYIVSREHLLVAVHQALVSQSRDIISDDQKERKLVSGENPSGGVAVRGLKTKSIHSEILWNLSISSNIMDSFKTFGVSDKTKDIIAVHIADEGDSPDYNKNIILRQIAATVQGTLERDGLQALDDWIVSSISTTTAAAANVDGNESSTRSPVDWAKVKKAYKLESFTDKDKIESLVVSMVAMKRVAA